MKKMISVMIVLVMMFALTTYSYADQVIYAPGPTDGMDMSYYINDTYTDVYGIDDWLLYAGGWSDSDWFLEFLIRFDLADLPSNPTSVEMWMLSRDSGFPSVDMDIDLVTEAWDEFTEWNNNPGSSFLGLIPATTPGYWLGLNIISIYNGWKTGVYPNYGFKFRPVSTNDEFSQFYSSDLSSINHWARPRLVVNYDGANLAFPLANYTPYTVPISSVFDHSMTATYETDSLVVAYTDERGDYLAHPDDETCISQQSEQPFIINGNYVGASSCGGATYLAYDGHPAFDYAVPTGIPVYAAATGTITEIQCPTYPGACTSYGRIRITHSSGYSTWYMHLSQQAGNLTVGTFVNKGDLIGYTGETGSPGSQHLHFEVRKNDSSYYGFPIDPYGWKGEWGTDPYQVNGKDNVCLWENCQWW